MKLLSTSVLVFALSGFVAFPVGAIGPAQSTTEEGPAITVTGTGEVLVDPDHAILVVAVESEGSTSATAGADNARLTKAVRTALVDAGAAANEVSTMNYSVQPKWQYSSSAPPRRTGYQATTTLRLTVARPSLLGSWIDAALSAGASRIDNIQFEPKDEVGARQQALTLTVANARVDAETLAKAAGGVLGPLQEMSTQQTAFRPGLEEVVVTAAKRTAEETNIQPRQLRISAAVIARWSFEPRP